MSKVLFVCSGNVCRSQMAEGFYNHYSKKKAAASAGTLEYTPLTYKSIPQDIVNVMKEEGIDISKHKVKTISREMVENAKEIYIMAPWYECPNYLRSSDKATWWEIEDPYGKGIEDLITTRNIIKSYVSDLLRKG